jgi:hypothetical protein
MPLTEPQRAPKELRTSGREVWLAVVEHLDLDRHETQLLLEACRTADRLDTLAADIAERGTVLPDGRLHPALKETREQQIVLTRLVASLRLPEDLKRPDARRPQRRGSSRGVYHLHRGEAS